MLFPLRQSTASQVVPLGPFLDRTDGYTAETALTIANTDIKLWKAGATSLVDKNSGGATHMSGGMWYATLDATDTNTIGPLRIFVHISAEALPVWLDCVVMRAEVYDALVAGNKYLETHPGKWADSGGNIILYERDGSTTQRSSARTTSGTAEPITSMP